MDIVIIGMGKLGRMIADNLSKEEHNITVIDTKSNLVEDTINQLDVKGIVGNGASFDVQQSAEVDKADVVIAVTSNDEVNIVCCLLAKKLGVKQTIARVRNPEYNKQMSLMANELGISMSVNPELDAANEISRILRFPSAIKVETFANGSCDLVELKVTNNSPLANKTLLHIRSSYHMNFLICAVKRNDSVIIPRGDFKIQAEDNVYITASTQTLTKLFKNLGIYKAQVKNCMIIGGGKISYYLANELSSIGVSVKIIEKDEKECIDLSEQLPKVSIINGDGSDQKLLLEEGITNTDALVTLTGMDESNIIISTFANNMQVEKVITKVNNANYGNIVNSLGLDSIISPKEITSNNIIRYVRGMKSKAGAEFKTLYRLVENKIAALEFFLPEETGFTSIPLNDLKMKSSALIACIIRNGEVIIPGGRDTLEVLDTVILVTTDPYIKDLTDILE